jgi:hypothetical protein
MKSLGSFWALGLLMRQHKSGQSKFRSEGGTMDWQKLFGFLVAVLSLVASTAFAQDFHELAGKQGCDSVMESRRSECQRLNDTKEKACAVQGSCDLDKQIAQVADYQAAIAKRDGGQINDADRDALQKNIDDMKRELDARKDDAQSNERAARDCADARQAVYDFFGMTMHETESAGRNAAERRQALLDALDRAEVLQKAAKDRRDALADAKAEEDRERWDEYVAMQDQYENNAGAYREAEAKLAEFKGTYGNDIDDAIQRLVNYYNSEQTGHRTAIEEQKNRGEKCGKLEYLSY